MDSRALFSALQQHALSSGLFERVNSHEPKTSPGNGVHGAVWFVRAAPFQRGSGLASTTGVVTFMLRTYTPMIQEPQDDIDPAVLDVVDRMFAAYSGDFTLGGAVREVDLLGAAGVPMSAQAGYLPMDGMTYRTVDITLPLIVSDVWTQAP